MLLIFSTVFTSCDCYQNVSGTVLDAATKQAIDSVYVHKKNRDSNAAYTNKEGNFKIVSISGGPFGCPPMTVVLSKAGYETVSVTIGNAKHETIFLKRKN